MLIKETTYHEIAFVSIYGMNIGTNFIKQTWKDIKGHIGPDTLIVGVYKYDPN